MGCYSKGVRRVPFSPFFYSAMRDGRRWKGQGSKMSEITYKLKPSLSGTFKKWSFRSGANFENAKQKKVDVIAGIIKGILADKVINAKEYKYISEWILAYASYFKTCLLSDVLLGMREKLKIGRVSEKAISELQNDLAKIQLISAGALSFAKQGFQNNIAVGIVNGLLADNAINTSEMQYLEGWIRSLKELSKKWPLCDLKKAIRSYKKNPNTLDASFVIYKYLVSFVGQKTEIPVTALRSINIFQDPDQDAFSFKFKYFKLSGRFELGTKAEVCEMIKSRGGHANPKHMFCDYLLVGSFGHPEWAYHHFGRKIETETQSGTTRHILSEQFLRKMLEKHPVIKEIISTAV